MAIMTTIQQIEKILSNNTSPNPNFIVVVDDTKKVKMLYDDISLYLEDKFNHASSRFLTEWHFKENKINFVELVDVIPNLDIIRNVITKGFKTIMVVCPKSDMSMIPLPILARSFVMEYQPSRQIKIKSLF